MTLTSIEIRILGALIEKELTTPAYYPLTLNSLRTACNQKSNRTPVMDLSEDEILHVLEDLRAKKLVIFSSGASQRVTKYKHNCNETFEVNKPELSLLAVLFLRGEQTAGELRTRAHRMYDFETLDSVYEIMEGLQNRERPLVELLSRRPGQKEQRYLHLLGDFEREEVTIPVEEKTEFELLQDEVEILKSEIESIKRELAEFKELLT